ncbi:MAG: carbamoyltransferase [Planctomycetes bacterium]|nr:carbamoyltransferase [Planctomycetota bacterium]
MTSILGISAYYHDSAAALIVDGRVVAAAQEERFTRKKHDYEFPLHAIAFCLQQGGLVPEKLDYVAFYDKPLLKFERLLETYLSYAPAGFRSFLMAMPLWLKKKLHLQREMRAGLDHGFKKRFLFTEHHESHAASAFFPSPFEEATILTLDGVGEWATASVGRGKGNRIELTHELRFPHSLGLLYSAFTYFTGFKVNSGEYKLMGLAPYGEPKYADLIREKLLDIKDDGSFRMDMSYFNYCQGLTMTSKRFAALFGRPPRRPEAPLSQSDMDIAASVQAVTEDIMLKCARFAHRLSGSKNLCLAGGVALNCVGNGRILREGPFEQIWIQPAAGDAGGALGAALFTWYQLLGNRRVALPGDGQRGSLLGPHFTNDAVRAFLAGTKAKFRYIPSEDELCEFVAAQIATENVVGWMQGPMEFGPRALGGRSILGDARSRTMQSAMNLKIKFRESFRPFAPSVLIERVDEFFEMRPREDSPYMLLVAPVQQSKRAASNGAEDGLAGIDKLKICRSVVPAVTHVDYSARVQTVDGARHGRYYKLLKAFERKTGCPVLINTSFNVRGEPIVCSPEHAFRCFLATNMDVLVLENYVLLKSEQPPELKVERDEYLAEFQLD